MTQFLNCLEILIAHNAANLTINSNLRMLTKLISKHNKMTKEAVKLQESTKRTLKRGKNQTEVASPKVEVNFECIWDLETCQKFVEIIFNVNPNEALNEVKQNKDFVKFVISATSQKIQQLPTTPDYLKLKYSRSSFTAVKSISIVLYAELELTKFEALHDRFDSDSVVALTEAFKNVIVVMDSIFNSSSKWQEFLKKTTDSSLTMTVEVIKSLQKIIEWAFVDEREEICSDSKGEKIVLNLFTAIELLFKNFQHIPNPHANEAYNWLVKFCKTTELSQKNLHVINKLLFQAMVQHDADSTMMEHIAGRISSLYGHLEENLP
jgi:FANCI solenoid 3